MDTTDATALDWFVRKGRGLNAAERAEFEGWIAGDSARAAAMERWNGDWNALGALPAASVDQLRRQIAADKAEAAASHVPMAMHHHLPPSPPSLFERLKGRMPRPASLALALCVSLATVLVGYQWRYAPVFEQTFVTRQGQQVDIELPDGSRLRLDTSTRAEVALYRQRREVRLTEGQAVFKVNRDPARPFEVKAGPVQVTVVGTRFSVRNTPQAPGFGGVHVAVEEGLVRVEKCADGTARGHVERVELHAGQQLTADAQGMPGPVRPLSSSGMAPWQDGRVSFDNVPLNEALAEFERYGRTGLVVRDERVGQMRLSGTFDPVRLANFRLALPKVLPVRLRSDAGTTEIVAAP